MASAEPREESQEADRVITRNQMIIRFIEKKERSEDRASGTRMKRKKEIDRSKKGDQKKGSRGNQKIGS